MVKKLGLIAVSSFTVGVLSGIPSHSAEDNILYRAVVKLIERYEELRERVERIEERVDEIEKRMGSGGRGSGHGHEVSLVRKGVVRVWLRFRSAPSLEGKVFFVLRPNEEVEILEEHGEWYKVRTKEGYIGFVHSGYVIEKRK